MRVLVAGAGALGSAVALRLQQEGAETILADPAPAGENASGVAAGMLAPAFEAVLDPASAGHFGLLMTARERWPALLEALEDEDAELDRSGALWVGDVASQATILERLSAVGASAEAVTSGEASRLSPQLVAPDGAVFTAEDWRLSPGSMLAALRRALERAGGRIVAAGLQAARRSEARLSDGQVLTVDQVVLATGLAPAGLEDPPPELEGLAPIKGQIARLAGAGPGLGPTLRAPGIYLAPGPSGVSAGATMEPGRSDRRVDPEAIRRLQALAAQLFPGLAEASVSGAAGVRASTPDALPMVGPSSRPGLFLALGARRNGWLLAPLIAEITADRLAGAASRWDAVFDPLRRFRAPG
jgi:glycine oxidase